MWLFVAARLVNRQRVLVARCCLESKWYDSRVQTCSRSTAFTPLPENLYEQLAALPWHARWRSCDSVLAFKLLTAALAPVADLQGLAGTEMPENCHVLEHCAVV